MAEQLPKEESFPPSFFANIGKPCCSIWGKSEIESIALAYVQALANDGDTWKKLTREQTFALLTDEQRQWVRTLLKHDWYQGWYDAVSNQITDADGAFGVRGFWHRGRAQS